MLTYTTCLIAQVYELPVFDKSDTPALHVDKVEITKEATYIYCTYSAIAASWANISKETYLLDETTKMKYYLTRCDGFPFCPERKTYLNAERCDIKFSFPSIKPQGKISFIEDSENPAFNVYGIDIAKRFEKTYLDTDVNRFFDMSSFYDSSGDSIKAIQFIENAISAAEYVYGIKSETKQLLLANASILCGKYGYYDRAIELAQQEETLYKELGKTIDENYALNLRIVAQWYSDAGNHEKAIELYKKSINLFESLNVKDKQYAYALRFLSDEYYRIGDNDNSFLYGEKSIQVRRWLGDETDYINELRAFVKPGNNKSLVIGRLELVENELDHLPKFTDPSSFIIAGLHKQIAATYNIIEQYNDAIKHCNKSIVILKGLGNDYIDEYVSVLSLKCKVLNYMGNKNEALVSGLDAKHIMDSLNVQTPKYAELLSDLANTYAKVYDYEKAIQLQNKACEVYEATSGWLIIAGAYNSLGDYYKNALDYDKAELYVRKAVNMFDKHDDVNQYYEEEVKREGTNISYNAIESSYFTFKSRAFSSLAGILIDKKKYSDAIKTELECGEIIKNMGDDDLYAEHLGSLSLCYWADKLFDDAKRCAKQSILYYERTNNPKVVTIYMILSCFCIGSGDIDEAIQYAEKALQISEKSGIHEMHHMPLITLSRLYLSKGNPEKAEYMMSEALNYLQRVITNDIFEMTSEQKQRMWDKYETFFLQYRGIIEKSNKCDSLLSKLYNYLVFSKSLLLESEMHRDFVHMQVNWRDIQQCLTDNDIAIEFYFTHTGSISGGLRALIIDNKCKAPRLINLFSYSDYEKLMTTRTKSALNTVGNMVWKEILKQYSPDNIYFCSDGFLDMVPIEYCNVDGIGEMTEHYNIFRLSSTKELLFNNQHKNYNKAILYGGLDYEMPSEEYIVSIKNSNGLLRGIKERGGFEPLPNTYDEIKEIANILNKQSITTALYSGSNGTEDSFKKLSGENVNIMHLSTHGMYVKTDDLVQKKEENNFDFLKQITNDDNPVKEDIMLTHSFLVMSGGNKLIRREAHDSVFNDGILTASEISQLDFHNLDLVVLSACETGLGLLELGGVFGLQRGFKKAGAKTILMSLNKVDDEATKILMVEFYRNLMDGKTKHQSLKNAQRYLRQVDNGKYDKPEYWASFIMLDGLNKLEDNSSNLFKNHKVHRQLSGCYN